MLILMIKEKVTKQDSQLLVFKLQLNNKKSQEIIFN